ncbi:MAG: P-II family nitrogen regulator [Gammaproteobacteria bacterium]|nr:P-II family nitrogen regulator [Gammaproteobacteria bacterium]
MKFKLVIAVTDDRRTKDLLKVAREAGATGATIIAGVRGEGRNRSFGILGLEISEARDMLLFVVEEHRARAVLEKLAEVGEFDETSGTGVAFQIDVEDALGVRHQMAEIAADVEERI